jgi:hypothetical protein
MEQTTSCPVSIFIAGDFDKARDVCRAYCDEVGLCVTVTPTTYVYTGGEEAGVTVGFINYPRFPKGAEEIEAAAIHLGKRLREALRQESFSVQTPAATFWFSWRAEDVSA